MVRSLSLISLVFANNHIHVANFVGQSLSLKKQHLKEYLFGYDDELFAVVDVSLLVNSSLICDNQIVFKSAVRFHEHN